MEAAGSTELPARWVVAPPASSVVTAPRGGSPAPQQRMRGVDGSTVQWGWPQHLLLAAVCARATAKVLAFGSYKGSRSVPELQAAVTPPNRDWGLSARRYTTRGYQRDGQPALGAAW